MNLFPKQKQTHDKQAYDYQREDEQRDEFDLWAQHIYTIMFKIVNKALVFSIGTLLSFL